MSTAKESIDRAHSIITKLSEGDDDETATMLKSLVHLAISGVAAGHAGDSHTFMSTVISAAHAIDTMDEVQLKRLLMLSLPVITLAVMEQES